MGTDDFVIVLNYFSAQIIVVEIRVIKVWSLSFGRFIWLCKKRFPKGTKFPFGSSLMVIWWCISKFWWQFGVYKSLLAFIVGHIGTKSHWVHPLPFFQHSHLKILMKAWCHIAKICRLYFGCQHKWRCCNCIVSFFSRR